MSAPVVPQRPVRSQQQQQPHLPTLAVDGPYVPARPARRQNPSQSPSREAFARSPLNDSPFAGNIPPPVSNSAQNGQNALARTPSVQNLPLIGQEGNEYAALDNPIVPIQVQQATAAPPNQTRNIAGDLPLHAPKASTPAVVAKTKISTVTRTDSAQAAAVGIGRPLNDYEMPDSAYRPPSAKPLHARPPSTVSSDRPGSAGRPESLREGEFEQGIPHIGLHVPMYPNAGDVQAPSPSAGAHAPATGVGFFNDGKGFTPIGRRKSREIFSRPPDSYGLHGHGSGPADQFERAWYQRHPEEAIKEEHGAYGPGAYTERTQWALSSDDLNKIVHKGGAGFGTMPTAIGIPPEQLGYIASEEYTSRHGSPRPPSIHTKSRTGSQTHADSPLRRTSFPINEHNVNNQTQEQVGLYPASADENAMESDGEDHVIHLDPIGRRISKMGSAGDDPSVEELAGETGSTDEHGGWINELGYGVPILASDELAKDPAAGYMHPAVDPEQLEHGDNYYGGAELDHFPSHHGGHRSAGSSRPGSRPSSRPASLHGAPISLSRFASRDDYEKSGTPLEEIEEYEPLFVDEETGTVQKRPRTLADKLKRPAELQRFPSRDIWEDTPNSLQLQTTVDSPQSPEDAASPQLKKAVPASVARDLELVRQPEIAEPQSRPYKQEEFVKPKFKSSVQQEVTLRPGLRQRFPSQDIWEDTPDSAMIQTTVGGPQSPVISPQEAQVPMTSLATAATGSVIQPGEMETEENKPTLPARPERSRDVGAAQQQQPSIPPRPPQKLRKVPPAEIPASADSLSKVPSPTDRRAPTLPDRPKPQIPPRPARASNDEQTESSPLAKSISASSAGSEGTVGSPPKPKPAVPSRPLQGSKLANIKAGFMDSLNSRLQKGPPVAGPKSTEQSRDIGAEEEEKAPLSDARKGRAKGPARRKPAAAVEAESSPTAAWGFAQPWTVWHIPHQSGLALGSIPEEPKEAEVQPPERIGSMSSPSPLDNVLPAAADHKEPETTADEQAVASPVEEEDPAKTVEPEIAADPPIESKNAAPAAIATDAAETADAPTAEEAAVDGNAPQETASEA